MDLINRSQVNDSDKWNVGLLYSSMDKWENDFASAKNEIEKYAFLKGKTGKSAHDLKEIIEFDLTVSRLIDKLYTYAHLKSDEDKTNSIYLSLVERAMSLYTKAGELSSFIPVEIQEIADDKIAEFKKSEDLKDYIFYIDKIIRYKPYTRSAEIEELLSASGDFSDSAADIFSQLDNADFTFGKIKDETGKESELTHGNFIRFLMNKSAEVRRNAFKQYYSVYESHKHALSSAFYSNCKKDKFYSKVRGYESCLDSALFSDDVNKNVYFSLIESVKKNIPPLAKYIGFRKEYLNLEKIHFYDTYVPLVGKVGFCMEYEEAVDTCVNALSILGEEYTSVLRDGLLNGWVDRYENKGKRSGAYSSGCFDSLPYILMNYDKNNINSLYTLIHEAGHSMHSYLSAKNQPYHYHRYTIFAAEVASTFNETLLSDYLLKKYHDNDEMRAYILNREIDDIRGTLYRQTMFAEFEMLMHMMAEQDTPLTVDLIRSEYRKLLETYFGGSIEIDQELELEALRIPHFYNSFYVYKYATGISAAISLAENVLDKGAPAVERYMDFLSAGGRMFPLDALKKAGVDMSKPETVNSALSHFSEKVDEFIKVMKR
ncbi:MAG: oligoendopeptidase F [Spirochaetes bacterium]|nr:oligoendopeptidase F [Spirochaetota bacterium]